MNFQQFFRQLQTRLQKSEKLMVKAPDYAKQIDENIAKSGAVNEIIEKRFFKQQSAGVPWKPLTPETIKRRKSAGFAPGPILMRTGKLFKGATSGKARASLNKITLPFKGRAYYGFYRNVNTGRDFYAPPSSSELVRINAYRQAQIASIGVQILNGRTPRITPVSG